MKKLNEYVKGNFLKAINVTSEAQAFVVTEVQEVKEKDFKGIDTEKLRLTLENQEIEYEFDLNRSNITFLINQGMSDPVSLVGKKIYFKKALVRNPKTNVEVEGLRIYKLE